jgi:hypothetical protein
LLPRSRLRAEESPGPFLAVCLRFLAGLALAGWAGWAGWADSEKRWGLGRRAVQPEPGAWGVDRLRSAESEAFRLKALPPEINGEGIMWRGNSSAGFTSWRGWKMAFLGLAFSPGHSLLGARKTLRALGAASGGGGRGRVRVFLGALGPGRAPKRFSC